MWDSAIASRFSLCVVRLHSHLMDREAHKSRSFSDADRWDREQQWSMTPEERLRIAKILRDRVYGENAPDVRESERSK